MRNVQSVLCGQSVAKQGTPVWPGRKTVSRYSLHQCFVVQFRPSNFTDITIIGIPFRCLYSVIPFVFFASWKVFSSEVWKLRIPVVCVVFENMCYVLHLNPEIFRLVSEVGPLEECFQVDCCESLQNSRVGDGQHKKWEQHFTQDSLHLTGFVE